jgi:hypothetical protein
MTTGKKDLKQDFSMNVIKISMRLGIKPQTPIQPMITPLFDPILTRLIPFVAGALAAHSGPLNINSQRIFL